MSSVPAAFTCSKLATEKPMASFWYLYLYSRTNNVELAGIPNSVRDNEFEGTVINICKDHRIEITPMDIEACHRLFLSNPQTSHDPNQCRKVIVKSVSCKHRERLLQIKKR